MMLTLYIRNLSQCKPLSDYEYVVMVNAEKIVEGKVFKHRRKDGWKPLVRRIVEQEDKEMQNGWTDGFDEIKTRIKELIAENEALKKENKELRSERDFLQAIVDSVGGRG
jgi:predicted nuclease with TOPRIM domain